ncbi:HD-GYP domain-containing protein [Alkalihalophilus lindianensis]|uniref:HD-GYP domain-containing protein n=1 Tax=Alkalihalophilus lindianensis TaxID=1630542 RepID=A0ABU3X8E1_9BACI|nr:HD-GYP domain-containing protein [Alkalihalophilus lindianensis]MDV2684156.1 HD-GYP domain-containing protein [Alkalihalophilus lindianensis]
MRLVAVKSVEPGAKLGRDIYNDNSQILLFRGAVLTGRLLTRLVEMGIHYIYIEDELTNDIMVDSVIRDETKKRAIKTIKEEFKIISEEVILKKTVNFDQLSQNFSTVVHSILADIKHNPDALAMLSETYVYDHYIFTHSLNVTIYTLGLATKLGYSSKQLNEIGLGALLHDVGKIAVPIEVLNKPGRLNKEEFELIKTHPKAGFDLLRDVPNIPLLAAHCAFQHHERLDGNGYPRGLTDNLIHPYAKIIGIADVFDAVTSHRVYRKPMLPHEGLELLYSGAGILFDKGLVETFRETIALYPVGLTVKLNDGRLAIVIRQNKQMSTRPVIRVFSESGRKLKLTYDIDLMEYLDTTIIETETTLATAN